MESDKDKPVIIKEGVLLKRQRGLHSLSLKKLKFQERYCMLSKKSLCYYDGEKEKGSFEVDRIKIVEAVPPETFKKDFCIQIGDDAEVLYFVAKSKAEMERWMYAFGKVASSNDNVMLPRYHTGAYGLLSHGKWSCCNKAKRQSKGCQEVFLNRSHTLQAQGTKNTTATELATQCRPTSFPCCVSNYPPPALPQCETSLPFQDEFRTRCHSCFTKSESPKMSPLLEDSHKCATLSTMRPSKLECSLIVEQYELGRQHYRNTNDSAQSIAADSGIGESLQNLPKSPEIEQEVMQTKTETETEKDIEILETEKAINALAFYGSILLSGSQDEHVRIWDVSAFKPVQSVKVSSSVLALDVWSHYLAIGSSVVQMVDVSSDELRRIIFVEDSEGIPSSPLPSHFVAFVGEEGHLATARADSTVVKVWPPPPQDSKIITSPEACITITGQIEGLSATHSSQASLLAVTIEKKEDERAVCLIDWKKHEDYKIIASSGNSSVSIHIAYSPDARQVSTGIGQEVDIWETGSGAKLHHFNTDAPVCSVVYSHDGSKLAVGLSTEEVEVFDPTSNHHLFTLKDPVTCTEGSSPATALAYSTDDKVFATGHQNGVLKLWKASTTGGLDATSHCLRNPLGSVYGMGPELYNDLEPLLARVETIDPQFNEDGIYEYHSVDDDFKLIIPKGAIAENHKVQVAVMKHGPIGPFEYPDGYKPVSPIIWLCSTQKEFQKDLEIILPHCSDFGSSDEEASQTQLVFLKASHDEYICNKNGQKVFQFKQVDAQPSFNPNEPYGSLHINHCCFYCVGEYLRKDTDQANLCLTVVKPHVSTSNYVISICLMLNLPTCRKALREQYPECDFKIQDIYMVKFANRNSDTALEIEIDRRRPTTAGWQIALMSSKIKVEDVFGFWDNFKTTAALVEACRNKLYPPRFNIEVRVSSKQAIMDTCIEVLFKGAADELKTEILLESPTRWTPHAGADLVVPQSQLHLPTGSEHFNSAGIPFSSERENPEDSGLHQQLHSFNGFVQRDQTDQVD